MSGFSGNMECEMENVARLIFWVSVGSLIYIYLGYPLLLALVRLVTPGRHNDARYQPTVTVLIAAYNEEINIERKLRETLALDYPASKLEVLVVSDDQIVSSYSDPRVRLLRVKDRHGKTHAQNKGVAQCRGDIVVFSDATAVYHPESIRRLAANYNDESVGAVSGRYRYFDSESGSPTGLGSIAFWNYENIIDIDRVFRLYLLSP
jgi:cellulose synthase/poly-beta-1,6-N-acetylglucosamine synthase-like glycosyltransferase